MIGPKNLWHCFSRGIYHTVMHDGVEHAGYLSFLGLLAIFPFLVFFTALAGLVGETQAGTALVELLLNNLPLDVANALRPRIVEIVSGPPQGLMTIAIIGAIWTSSSAVEGLRTILNRAYRVETPPAYLWRRTLSILQFFLFTLSALIGMLLVIFVPLVLDNIARWVGFDWAQTKQYTLTGLGVVFTLILLVVSSMYYLLPNIKQRFMAVVPGALLVTVLWVASAMLFSYYLSNFQQVSLIYGSLEGIIATLLFFYMLMLILIFGAEFNYLFERALGHRIVQKEVVDSKAN